jgi:RNA polymerase sigma factor (sigma-70 family)
MPTATPTDDWLPTRESLLSRLRDAGDDRSWREFFDRYWQLIYKLARRRGLDESEAQEALQETLIALARTMPEFRYEPAKCSFKSWLRHLTEKKVADQFRGRTRRGSAVSLDAEGADSESLLASLPDAVTLPPDEAWDREWEENLVRLALDRVKERANPLHFQAFHRLVVLGFSAGEAARTLELSRPQVYLAKHRIAALLKQELRALQRQYP